MGENGVCVLINPILHTFDTAYAKSLTKSLALNGFGEIFTHAI